MDRKLSTSPGVGDTYTLLMNTWNTFPESYQLRGYTNTPATVKHPMQQAENPLPAVVISMEAAIVDNACHLDHLTSEVALGDLEIGSTDQNIPIGNDCMDAELHFRMPGCSGDYEDEHDESDKPYAILTVSRQRQAATSLGMFNLGLCDLNRYESEDGDYEDADEEEEQLQANDGSIQNVEDRGQSTRECEDWSAYFRPVKCDNGEANAMGNDVFKRRLYCNK